MQETKTITVEELQKLAKTSPLYKGILRKVFPDVDFGQKKKVEKHFNLGIFRNSGPDSAIIFSENDAQKAGFVNKRFLQICNIEPYKNKGFYLDPTYHWAIRVVKGLSDESCRVLVPTRKPQKKKK